ncbi:MAG: protein kinase domain-containing protein [Bryobacteraceae bacterium]
MRFAAGTRLGSYEVVAELGAGAMGEVYRARDTTLHREVAIKLVHPAFCHHADSLLRLRREAQALAALNHPNVATLHELAEFDGGCGLVMELVDGETLGEALAGRRLPLSEVLRLAAQVAAALEAAHERGIVHRDLKPANIKITSSGAVKVLDFGLAKSEKDSPTAMMAETLGTAAGTVLGTACYMSPEQARGADTDRRTDIWAFGCVLFEMLTARRAFDGPSPTDVLVSILEREPDWSGLPAKTPPQVERVVRRCLEKDVRRRLRDVGDARLELEDALAPGVSVGPSAERSAAITPRRSWVHTTAALSVGAAIGGALVAGLTRTPSTPAASEVRFSLALPDGETLATTDFPALAISPDGRLVTYITGRGGTTQLSLRRLDAMGSLPLQGTSNALSPFFSPDSQWIAFFADGKLKKVPVGGGPPISICDASAGFGGSWGSDDTIVFAPSTGSALQRVSANGGTPARATRLDPDRDEFSHRWPEFLTDSRTILFTVGTVGEWDEAEIVAQSLETGQRATIVKGGTHPHYLAGGYLAYTHASAVWAVPFDPRRLAVTGPPARLIEGVAASVDGAAQFGVSRTGVSVHLPSNLESHARRLVALERSDVTPLAAPARGYVTPRVSPDGRRVLVGVSEDSEHVWVYDLSAGALRQLTFDAANRTPVWAADGQRMTFASNRSGALNLFSAPADGSGAAERLTTSDYLQVPGSWSPDGAVLAFVEHHPTTGRDIWLWRARADRAPFANSAFDESAPRFSPDGRWIAYVSNESGQAEVYVQPAAGPPARRQISTEGGLEPVWRRDGRALYYRAQTRLMTVPVHDGASLRTGPAQLVFEGAVEAGTFDAAGYDTLAGTDQFVMITSASKSVPTELQVILNWTPALPAR